MYSRVVRYLVEIGKLHFTARQGVITLLPKKDKDLSYLENWRPLTLLNVDYKIISRAIAMRLKLKIKDLVSEDQTGFIEGRDISHNLRTVFDIIQVAKERSLDMVIISMDWQKCFDRISPSAIDGALDFFNFGTKFRKIVQMLLQDSESLVINNGHLSQPFKVFSGVKQGANASPLLYDLLAEVLSIYICKNSKIKGITLGDVSNRKEFKLIQFADDMNLF